MATEIERIERLGELVRVATDKVSALEIFNVEVIEKQQQLLGEIAELKKAIRILGQFDIASRDATKRNKNILRRLNRKVKCQDKQT